MSEMTEQLEVLKGVSPTQDSVISEAIKTITQLQDKIDLALRELAHVLGEKSPTEIRIEKILKGE